MEGSFRLGTVASVPFEFAISSLDGSRTFCTTVNYDMLFENIVLAGPPCCVVEWGRPRSTSRHSLRRALAFT